MIKVPPLMRTKSLSAGDCAAAMTVTMKAMASIKVIFTVYPLKGSEQTIKLGAYLNSRVYPCI
jgi:hypothetical protein